MVKMVLSLTIICLIAATALAFIYQKTVPLIELEKANKLTSHLKIAFPGANEFIAVLEDTLWEARDRTGAKLGIVFLVAPRGYAGPIETLVGCDLQGKIVGLRTATPSEGLKETPGLGVKVNEEWFQKQFVGKMIGNILLKNDGGTMDAITAATISSRAVVTGVREGLQRFREHWKPAETQKSEQDTIESE